MTLDTPHIEPGLPQALCQAWQELCDRYLPVVAADSLWRYHCAPHPDAPEQGWKLHLSATVLNAHQVLERVAPLLTGCGVQFKAPATLPELGRLNAGLHYGYSQVGKFITVYPQTSVEAVALAHELHARTRDLSAPVIPFDRRFRPDSNVYYRYGAFKRLQLESPDGTRRHAIRDPQGRLVPDERTTADAKPDWVEDPFPQPLPRTRADKSPNPLNTKYRVFRALAQRGKGGVYQAVDCSAQPPRLCLLKEGRQHGEVTWDGRDGCWRVRHEERVLGLLRAAGVAVPRVYASFALKESCYLATEFIAGESLGALLHRLRRRLPVARALRYAGATANVLASIHAAGWVWRDCKPANLMLTPQGEIRPLDFEGACPIDQPDALPWGTPAFTPPPARAANNAYASVPDDLYALGAISYLLLTGRVPDAAAPLSIAKLRRGVPMEVAEVVMALLTATPQQRPSAALVARQWRRFAPYTGRRLLAAQPVSA